MEFVHPDDRPAAIEALEKRVRGGAENPIIVRIFTRQGVERSVEVSDRVLKDAQGAVIQIVALMHDVTGRLRTEEELRQYREHLEHLVEERTADLEAANAMLRTEIDERKLAMAALQERSTELRQAKEFAESCNRAKTEFMANISHELRTPLHAIMGFSDLLLSKNLPEEVASCTGQIVGESTVLLSLLDELLDLAKVEAGKLVLEEVEFNLENLIEEFIKGMAIRTERKGLSLQCSISESVPRVLTGDPHRLRQVLNNLVGNAVKFTEKGSVSLKVVLDGIVDETALISFHISDTGIGIPLEKQACIFESFMQADGSTTRKYGGTGLGTTISRLLVTLMKGSIGLESEPGRGSTFWFFIPFKCVPIQKKPEMPTTESQENVEPAKVLNARILLAEDYPTNRTIAVAYLSGEGYEVECTENGKQALEAAMCSVYDLVIMDIQMPEMDGYEAAMRIRRESVLNDTTPILALTANAYADDIEKCFASGMNEVITKPIRRDSFIQVVKKWIGSMLPGNTIPAIAGPVIHDDESMIMDYDRALQEFENDREALSMVTRMFVEHCARQIGMIQDSLASGELERIRAEAHKIKGGAGNLCAALLADAAAELEKAAGSSLREKIPAAVSRVKNEFMRLEELAKIKV
jgi:signal transduction histidine kinase/DNA-binding NarL/FixJ family response regulator